LTRIDTDWHLLKAGLTGPDLDWRIDSKEV